VWWTAPPSIVAESLEAVPDPLMTVLRPGAPASGMAVAGALARSLAPEEATDAAPPWLLPEQVQSFRRVIAALRRHGGAVLADPVGSGKTYIALAAAATLNRGSTACLVPATLLAQWESLAARLGVPVTLCSHQQVSRGKLPKGTRGLVVIDESHHFRNSGTRRYRYVAPWLVGRTALMVTATPVVNRATDLGNQLLLAVRDDALLLDGIASLRTLLTKGCTTASLGQLVVEGDAVSDRRPGTISRITRPTSRECAALNRIIEMLGRLRLSRSQPIAALLRGVLLRSAGSSPAALGTTLCRYRRLLLHARDALGSGKALDRAEIRRFTRELGDQLIWWELMPPAAAGSDIELSDLGEIDDLIQSISHAAEAGDDKLTRLCEILSNGVPSLVFTAFRETVRYLRDRVGDCKLAWCTGERAGIGRTALPRPDVLGWFRAGASSSLGPRHLVVTDVAAEGLDLQRAGRVVHYDLPWTPMRLDQREGRSVRYGSRYAQVEVVRFALPPALEHSLGMESMLARKRRLPALVGLGPAGKHVWRWRNDLALRFAGADALAGAALVVSPHEGLLAGFALQSAGDRPACLSTSLLWLERDGSWTEAPEALTLWLERAGAAREIVPIEETRLRSWLVLLARPIKDRLTLTGSRRWVAPDPAPAVRRMAARLQALTREAARRHQPSRLVLLEHALEFVTRGHTAGEAALIARLADSSDAELDRVIPRLQQGRAEWGGLEARLTGLVLFGPRS
jgi:superfamily II DNA or RNA helicase